MRKLDKTANTIFQTNNTQSFSFIKKSSCHLSEKNRYSDTSATTRNARTVSGSDFQTFHTSAIFLLSTSFLAVIVNSYTDIKPVYENNQQKFAHGSRNHESNDLPALFLIVSRTPIEFCESLSVL